MAKKEKTKLKVKNAGASAPKNSDPKSNEAKEKRAIIIKAIAAAVAFLVGIGAFTVYAKQCTHKEAGWYVVDANPNESAPRYAAGMELNYYFGGESNDIHTALNAVRLKYSEALAHIYKLLDSQNDYEGYVNLHYINTHPGEGIELDPLLFDVLKDALALTEQGGFDLFGGALFYEWQSVTVLADPTEQDPLLNPDEAQRISRIVQMNADRSNFSLEITDEAHRIVKFTISDEYRAMLDELEADYPVLDLGPLRQAYETDYLVSELEKDGWTQGFVVTDTGMTRAMSGADGGVYLIYSADGDTPLQAGRFKMLPGSAFAALRSFPLEEGELGYYTVETGSGAAARHPHFDYASGVMGGAMASACALDTAGSLQRAWLAANSLINCAADEAAALAKGRADEGLLTAYMTADEPLTVRIDAAHAELFTVTPSGAFTVETY